MDVVVQALQRHGTEFLLGLGLHIEGHALGLDTTVRVDAILLEQSSRRMGKLVTVISVRGVRIGWGMAWRVVAEWGYGGSLH